MVRWSRRGSCRTKVWRMRSVCQTCAATNEKTIVNKTSSETERSVVIFAVEYGGTALGSDMGKGHAGGVEDKDVERGCGTRLIEVRG